MTEQSFGPPTYTRDGIDYEGSNNFVGTQNFEEIVEASLRPWGAEETPAERAIEQAKTAARLKLYATWREARESLPIDDQAKVVAKLEWAFLSHAERARFCAMSLAELRSYMVRVLVRPDQHPPTDVAEVVRAPLTETPLVECMASQARITRKPKHNGGSPMGMTWKPSRIVLKIWTAGESNDLRICENPEASPDERFRLDVVGDCKPRFFTMLETAKSVAESLNEIALLRAENQHLKDQLADKRNADAFSGPSNARRKPMSPRCRNLAAMSRAPPRHRRWRSPAETTGKHPTALILAPSPQEKDPCFCNGLAR